MVSEWADLVREHAEFKTQLIESQERESKLKTALIKIARINFAGPSNDERREWTWATAQHTLDALKDSN